jgi:hypothetical protein
MSLREVFPLYRTHAFYRFSTVNHRIHRKMGSIGSALLTHTRANIIIWKHGVIWHVAFITYAIRGILDGKRLFLVLRFVTFCGAKGDVLQIRKIPQV